MSGGWEKPPKISDTSRGGREKTCVWQRWSFPIGGSDVRIVQQSAKHKREGQPHSRNHTDVSLTACNGHDARDLSILEYPRKKASMIFEYGTLKSCKTLETAYIGFFNSQSASGEGFIK